MEEANQCGELSKNRNLATPSTKLYLGLISTYLLTHTHPKKKHARLEAIRKMI